MKNPFLRLVALLLVPCLGVDPATAFELCSARQTAAPLSTSVLVEFSRQAIVAYLPSSPFMVRATEGLGHVHSSWLGLSRFLDLEIDKSGLGLPTGITGRATARWISWFYNWGQRLFGWKDETIDRFIAPAWETLIFQGLFVLFPTTGIFFGELFLLHWLGTRSTVLDHFSSLSVALISGAAASQAISATIFGSVRTHPKIREYGPPGKNQRVKVRDPSPAELMMLMYRVRRYGRWAVKMFGIFLAVALLLMYCLNISNGAVYWIVLLTAVVVAILIGLLCAYDIHGSDNRNVIDLTGGIVGTAAGGADATPMRRRESPKKEDKKQTTFRIPSDLLDRLKISQVGKGPLNNLIIKLIENHLAGILGSSDVAQVMLFGNFSFGLVRVQIGESLKHLFGGQKFVPIPIIGPITPAAIIENILKGLGDPPGLEIVLFIGNEIRTGHGSLDPAHLVDPPILLPGELFTKFISDALSTRVLSEAV